MNRKFIFSSILLFSLILLMGCGARELNDLAMVMAVGLDKGEEPGSVRVTAQIARPADARGQTGAPSGQTGEPIWTATGEGKTIFEAIRNLGRYSSRRVFWAHNFVIVISEDLAKQGITDVIDFFTRNHELRMKTWVVVTPGKARELVATKTGLEVIPGESIDKLFRYSEIIAEAPRSDMRRLAAAYMSESSHPVLARVHLKNRQISSDKPQEFGSTPQVELSGTAVFNKAKMVGWLTPKESRGLLWFIERVESGVVVLPCPDNPEEQASLELRQNKFEITPSYTKGKIAFTVNLQTFVDLVELGCATPKENPTLMKDLEKDLEATLREEIEAVVEKAQQEYKVDFIKLGETFENRYPAEWQVLRSKWKDVFPNAEVMVNVTAQIKSPVLLENPTRPVKD